MDAVFLKSVKELYYNIVFFKVYIQMYAILNDDVLKQESWFDCVITTRVIRKSTIARVYVNNRLNNSQNSTYAYNTVDGRNK